MPTCLKCNIEFPNRVEIDGKIRNLSRRKFCLTCSQFAKRKLIEDLNTKLELIGKKFCSSCQKEHVINNFHLTISICKQCQNKLRRNKKRRRKLLAIQLLGGECQQCCGKFHPCAFDFHHKDSKQKDFNIGKAMDSMSWRAIKKELDKCILLCSNCHRSKHAIEDGWL